MTNTDLMLSLMFLLTISAPKWASGDEDGFREINVADIQVQAMARRAMRRVNEMTTHFRYLVPLEILNARQQSNQFGMETIITMKIQESTCFITILNNDAPHPSCVPFKYGAKELVTVSISALPDINDEMVHIISIKPL